jgi:hypothetical protein
MRRDVPVAMAGPSRRGPRAIAFAILSAIFAVAAAGGLLGVGLFFGWFDNQDGGIHRVHFVGYGILWGVLLTVAFGAMTHRPERKVSAFYQVLATALASLIAGLASSDDIYLIFGLLVVAAAAILLALHPARSSVLHPTPSPSLAMIALVLVGSIPLVSFGLTMARIERSILPNDPHMDHWANTATMAFGLVLVGLLASTRLRGWRLTAWCAGLGTAIYGLASIVFRRFPGTNVPYAGGKGATWGLLALLGGLAFIAVAEWEARRPPGKA